MSPHQLERWFVEGTLAEDTLIDILHQCSVVPLLYDEGGQLKLHDFHEQLESALTGDLAAAADALYTIVIEAFQRYNKPETYEQLQDIISLQEDLCMSGILTVSDWIDWLERCAQGEQPLPTVDYHSLFEDLPEGYMLQDFHDDLTFILQQPEHDQYAEAVQQQSLVYRQLGVKQRKV
ncbi:hypothetical protein [Paenibacillus campi]|uniref:hypothetical protein n=1 Tax=Paenibacillus campi TaxID=3106031 RepID=UPI002AFE2C35|nr:hypothetical protein [Paenibacillus sp. SGZ-1009]